MTDSQQRIDAHIHLWQIDRGDYDWMTAEVAPLMRDYTGDDLRPLLADAAVTGVVAVQAAATVAETEYLLGLAAEYDFIKGVVGWVDLSDPAASEVITRLAGDPYFKGIRPMIQDIEDPAWMLGEELRPGLQALIDNKLTFDSLVKPPHLPYLRRFLSRYPDLRSIICHAAKPDIAAGEFDEWADHMRSLAADTNTLCKFSGLVTEAGESWSVADLKPFADHLIACFGSERLVFGSDWPVVTLASTYAGWTDIAQALLSELSPAQLTQIFGGNATAFYGL